MADENGNTDPLWTAEEVADYLTIAESTVSQWAKIGKLPVVKVGSLNRFRKSDLDAWLSRNARPAEEKAS